MSINDTILPGDLGHHQLLKGFIGRFATVNVGLIIKYLTGGNGNETRTISIVLMRPIPSNASYINDEIPTDPESKKAHAVGHGAADPGC